MTISFHIDGEDGAFIPDALRALVETAATTPGSYEVGPFDDRALLDESTIFVRGDDEVEAAEALVANLLAAAVPFTAL